MNRRRVWPEVRDSGLVLCGIVRRKLGRDMSRMVGRAFASLMWHPAWLERGRPMWPEEVVQCRYRPRPPEVYDVFNELIESTQCNGYSVFTRGEVVQQVMIRCRVCRQVIDANGWLLVDHEYERRGFEVSYVEYKRSDLRNMNVSWTFENWRGEPEDVDKDTWTFLDNSKVQQTN